MRKKAMHELAGGGDDGTTGLLGGGRAPKDDLRIEAYGTVDEASSAIGLAKALTADERVREIAERLQRDLYRLGAELATNPGSPRDRGGGVRISRGGNPEDAGKFVTTSEDDVAGLDRLLAELEAEVTMPQGFVLPGATPASGALDLARAVVRRAERRCVTLIREGGLANDQARRYLNRLSLVLFVLGRYEEARTGSHAKLAKEP